MPVLVKVCELCKLYPLGNRREKSQIFALDHVSLSIDRGEYVAIVGQSGSGKSTLMNLLGCLDAPSSGEIFLSSQILQKKQVQTSLLPVSGLDDKQLSLLRNREIGFVFQSFNLISSLTALENVELPLLYRALPRKERRHLAEAALRSVGLSDRAKHYPSQLSGGQQQRVAVARAIAASPSLILADEPTGNLDPAAAKEMVAIFRSLHQRGATLVLITHDPQIAAQAQRRICIENGKLVADSAVS